MAAARRAAWAPWAQPARVQQPGLFGASAAPRPLSQAACAPAVEAQCVDTLYESSDGNLVVDEGVGLAPPAASSDASACARQRCCAFAPDPAAVLVAGPLGAASQHSRPSRQAVHAAVHAGSAPAPAPLQRWGVLGVLLDGALQGGGALAWIAFEHQVISLLLAIPALVVELLRQVVLLLTASAPTAPPTAAGGAAAPAARRAAVAWHPHRDVLATLSEGGAVAVHAMGGALAEACTTYLHAGGGSLGEPLCLDWQPNDLRGALALGLSCGVTVWRCSPRGWAREWCLPGAAFACPALAWSPSGRCLAAAGDRGVVRVWPHDGPGGSRHGGPQCVTLRRWRGVAAADVRWAPDGALLAVAHAGGRQPFVRLWDTSTWEVALHVSAGAPGPAAGAGGSDACAASLAWCGGKTLLGAGAGQLFELGGLAAPAGGWVARGPACGAACRVLATPHVRLAGAAGGDDGHQAVLEVAVCPRTAQRVAVRVRGAPHVLLFERLGSEGWAKQELAFRGLVSAAAAGGPTDASGRILPAPCALAFAGKPLRRAQWGLSVEGSLLAVYWEFGEQRAEVRTYPMHYLPYKLMQSDASVVFD